MNSSSRPSKQIFTDSRPSRSNPIMDNSQNEDLNESQSFDSSRRINRSISPLGQPEQTSFESSEILKPMLLVDIDNKGMMKINRKAIEYLQAIRKNLAVLAVVGPYRTGKSFLMNRFAGYQKGFELGSSTNPCTQGIWIWGKPLRLDDNTSLLLLDTEGLASYTRDENIDAKLFLLTCLLTSSLVYNVTGSIDERALSSLSFIANLSKYINVKTAGDKYSTNQDISKYFPALHWAIRDFALDLGGRDKAQMTPKDYLENCLSSIQGDTEEIMEKNKIRRAICDYFKDRECHTLIRPVSDESALRNIDKIPYEKLRPGFREQLEEMISRIFNDMRPKMINDTPVNGKVFTDLLITFVDSLNNSAMPSITSAWERIVDKEVQKTLNSAIDYYSRVIKSETEGKFPMNEDVFKKKIEDVKRKGEAILTESTIISEHKLIEAKEKYKSKLKDINELLAQENSKRSREFCTKFAQHCIDKMEKDLKSDKYKFYSHLTKEFYYYKKVYFDEARGPMKMEIFTTFFLENFLRISENYHSDVKTKKENEVAELDKKMATMTGENKALAMLLEQERENTKTLLSSSKERYNESKLDLERKLMETEHQWEAKLEEAERWKKRLQAEKDDLRSIIEVMRNQGVASGKSEHLSQELSRELSKLDSNVAKDVASISETLQSFTAEIREMHQEKFDLRLKYQMEKEIVHLEKRHMQQLLDAKSLSSKVMEKLRESYDTEIKELQEEIKDLEKTKELNLVKLIEKEGHIRVLQEKIISYERESKKQIDHADMLCKISDQLVRVARKIERS